MSLDPSRAATSDAGEKRRDQIDRRMVELLRKRKKSRESFGEFGVCYRRIPRQRAVCDWLLWGGDSIEVVRGFSAQGKRMKKPCVVA
ncbi:hypothetical protein MUK42_34212 [Musa troglodytarum]|uniref:Uncharacterized protein n=1 Tax=Musa troglodytarum TaxID=320322 RepID=A0A9E7GDZ3_9LILI|nr:hypothetical protein MUK42_34212 [Musa troglodytarum]